MVLLILKIDLFKGHSEKEFLEWPFQLYILSYLYLMHSNIKKSQIVQQLKKAYLILIKETYKVID